MNDAEHRAAAWAAANACAAKARETFDLVALVGVSLHPETGAYVIHKLVNGQGNIRQTIDVVACLSELAATMANSVVDGSSMVTGELEASEGRPS